jgi:hypothetical protein
MGMCIKYIIFNKYITKLILKNCNREVETSSSHRKWGKQHNGEVRNLPIALKKVERHTKEVRNLLDASKMGQTTQRGVETSRFYSPLRREMQNDTMRR